jgi:hypothetical protein
VLTTTLAIPDFFFLLHVSVKVDACRTFLIVSLPASPLGPSHAPDATHALAFVADQVIVTSPPAATLDGFAVSEMFGSLLDFPDFSYATAPEGVEP